MHSIAYYPQDKDVRLQSVYPTHAISNHRCRLVQTPTAFGVGKYWPTFGKGQFLLMTYGSGFLPFLDVLQQDVCR